MSLFSLIDINGGECCHSEHECASIAPGWDGMGWDGMGWEGARGRMSDAELEHRVGIRKEPLNSIRVQMVERTNLVERDSATLLSTLCYI